MLYIEGTALGWPILKLALFRTSELRGLMQLGFDCLMLKSVRLDQPPSKG